MDFFEFSNKEKYNNFLIVKEFSPFQQSWQWGEFQKEYGRKVFRLGVKEGENIQLTAQLIKMPLPLGKSYFYCPRGPVLRTEDVTQNSSSAMAVFIDQVKRLAKQEKAILFRFDPAWQEMPSQIKKKFQLKKADPIQPQDTLVLNLNKSEDELLSQMKSKTRYNIRLAKRKDVTVRASTDQKDIEIFLDLVKSTYKRQIIKPHPDQYYRQMFQVLAVQGVLKIYIAEFNNKPLVANIVITFGQTATYVHGASSEEHKNVMAPHLTQWQAIKDAKQAGVRQYDFFGIAPEGSPKEKTWQGITRFKTGFGGREIRYAGAFDLLINKIWCKIYNIAKKTTGKG